MNNRFAIAAACAAAMLIDTAISTAQPQLPLPEASPKATVSQKIGISEVQVSYHRPGIKGRTVWGKLVPYGEVWRAGANENTTISFSHPVTVGGRTLASGTYGLHMIPTQTDWTIIFSRNATSWGSFFYKESEDALRITVKPQTAEQRDWLQYEFTDLTDSSAVLSLLWEKTRVPIALMFDTRGDIITHARDVFLRGLAGFSWQGFNQAAQFCLRNDMNLPEALTWADASININENFGNLYTKAALLEKMGNTATVAGLRAKAMKIATEADINNLGYTYLAANKTKEALEMFSKNAKAYPESWNAYDSLAEGLDKSGDSKGAIANYEKALKLVVDAGNRKRIGETIAKLKAK